MRGGNSEEKGRGKAARCSADLVPLTEAGGRKIIQSEKTISSSFHSTSPARVPFMGLFS